ncbi:unnamed protein product, partial [Rotaria sp. Silwood2]
MMTTAVKRALIIGNDSYEGKKRLESCINDAKDMSEALNLIGFHVKMKTDLPYMGMDIVTNRFIKSIRPGDLALFYFSGHGSQFEGKNYLKPIEDVQQSEDEHILGIDAQKLIMDMHQRRPRLVIFILDCCRNVLLQPPARMKHFFSVKSARMKDGLTAMQAPPATIIAYPCAVDTSTLAGTVEDNSLYTCFLLRNIVLPIEVEKMLKKTALEVQKATD